MSWAAVAGSVIAGVGGYISSKRLSKKSKSDKAAQDALTANLQQLSPLGQQYTRQGSDILLPAARHFSNLLGSREEAMGEIAPELNARAEGDRSAIRTMGEVAPRGGVSSDFLSRLPFRRIGETTNLLRTARSDAAGKLGMIGSDLIGKGLSAFGATQGGALGQLGYGLQNNQQQYSMGSDAGAAFYDFIRNWTQNRNRGAGSPSGDPSRIYASSAPSGYTYTNNP